jgi:hypothetical protein
VKFTKQPAWPEEHIRRPQLESDFHGCPGVKKVATFQGWFVGALMKLLWGTVSFVNFPFMFGWEPPTAISVEWAAGAPKRGQPRTMEKMQFSC